MAEDWRTAYGRVKMELEEYKETIVPALMDKVQELEQRWIPVTERLPEMLYDYTHDAFGETCEVYRSKPVLASDGREVCTVEWVRFSEGEILMEVSRLDGGKIEPTHWMPLPEPPRENVDRHIETECANK
jgi:hypothetical protein